MRTQAEIDFIDQYARKLTVEWADAQLHGADISASNPKHRDHIYFVHALERGWVSKAEPHRLLAKGLGVATSFLKR
jgi:hypothetical protein